MNRTDMTRYIAERLGNLATNDDAERLYQFLRAADKIRATEAGELEIDGDIDLLAEYERMETGASYLTLTDAGRTVTARVHLDERGAPRDFSTTDRFADLPTGLTRAEWRTPVSAWTTTPDGRPFPGPMAAVWHLPDGELPYVEGRIVPESFEVDGPPTW